MKKTILLSLAFIVLATFSMEAQRSKSVKSGFKLGANISSLDSDTQLDGFDESRIGFMAGFFLEIPISGNLHFQPEIQYSAQGAKDEDFRADYINVPLLVKLNVAQAFNVHLGGQANIKVWEWEQRDNYGNFGYDAVGGIGINLSESLFIEGRYVYGLSNVLDEPNNLGIDDDVTNSYIQIALGIKI